MTYKLNLQQTTFKFYLKMKMEKIVKAAAATATTGIIKQDLPKTDASSMAYYIKNNSRILFYKTL